MFIYTQHALQKMDAFGIEKREVENAVTKGMKWKEETSDKWHANLAGLEIIFIKQNHDFFIVTVYLAGRSK